MPVGSVHGYVRFISLSAPRTGSTMLAQLLNSHPEVRCFGEVLNTKIEFISYRMPGYARRDPEDKALRDRDPMLFLRQRIFTEAPSSIRAVGFKLMYGDLDPFPEVVAELRADEELRVVHLKRHNLLRTLVSSKIVAETGLFFEGDFKGMLARELQSGTLRRLVRRPRQTLKRYQSIWRARKRRETFSVEIEPQELSDHIATTLRQVQAHDALFQDHETLELTYDELVTDRHAALARVQAFLGVTRHRMSTTFRKQNPEPLSELISNYSQLREAFKGSEYAWYFED